MLSKLYNRLFPARKQSSSKPTALIEGWTQNNVLAVDQSAVLRGHFSVKAGEHNTLTVGKGSKISGDVRISGSSNKIIIGDNCVFRGQILVKGSNQTVSFGDESTTADVYILCQEGADVIIGKKCMFSREIELRTTDAHSVIDRATGLRINGPASIRIGDHVWVGVGAIINKGSSVPSDCIVGAMSFVNRGFDEEGVILAGTPAKIVKRNITWDRRRKKHFSEEAMNEWRC
jgi:acetyltransferase-like isoleucine patch superfamily enzyme